MDQMIHEREERINTETFELEREKMISCVTGERNKEGYYPFKDYSDEMSCRKGFETENIPYYSPDNWGGEKTNLYKQLEELRVQTMEVLKTASSLEDLEESKMEFLKRKNKIGEIYLEGKEMISQFSNFFSKILKSTQVAFVSEQVSEFYKKIHLLENITCDGDLKKLEQAIEELKQIAEKLPDLSIFQKEIKDQQEVEARKNLLAEAGKLGIPEYILNAFNGDIQNSVQFMANVSKIETWRLDEHELSCGRGRASATCKNAWSAMGETSSFFCGADPNDVKNYVYEYHFGEDALPVFRTEERGNYNKNLSTSNDAMAEALRKVGLI
jgi:cell fate (sporulation/competence/biofilm development) regulator YmcA (YheA/YmcA/DUF963 family)